jgi:hypothetical protein
MNNGLDEKRQFGKEGTKMKDRQQDVTPWWLASVSIFY